MKKIILVQNDDPILKEPSLREIKGHISVNYVFNSSGGCIIFTSDVDLFNSAKYIFTKRNSGGDQKVIDVTEIKYYKERSGTTGSFGGPFRVTYYISSENSKQLAEYKLRNS